MGSAGRVIANEDFATVSTACCVNICIFLNSIGGTSDTYRAAPTATPISLN